MNNPVISVILPAYNAEKYLSQSIESILKQSFKNFELIVINDGSKDGTEAIILSFSDKRIRYIKNDENLGLIGSLNKGLGLAKGKYIARMDADDISYPQRFFLQYQFLEKNQEYVICSSSRKEFNDENTLNHISNLPVDDTSIRISSIFSTPFTHPAVMFRKSITDLNNLQFDSNFKYAEDYELWIRILSFGKGYNFKEVLLDYRDTPNSQTSVGIEKSLERKRIISAIQQKALMNIDLNLDEKELSFLYILSLSSNIRKLDFNEYSIKYIKEFFVKIRIHLESIFPNDKNIIRNILGKRYLKILIFNRNKLSLSQTIRLGLSDLVLFGTLKTINEKGSF